ncbi:MAG: hypothetical protein ACRDP9_13390 [Kribbellaceae bacterium]
MTWSSQIEALPIVCSPTRAGIWSRPPLVAQFGASVRVFRSFSRVRRARNSFEYPDTETGGPTTDDVDDVLSVATQAHRAALTILDRNLLTPWK